LVGDAAGLASGLTGEGIYSALVSGQEVARMIVQTNHEAKQLEALVRRHTRHRRLATMAVAHPNVCPLLMEIMVLLLRLKIIAFRHLEMAE
jgi:geranylgeranyl reductase